MSETIDDKAGIGENNGSLKALAVAALLVGALAAVAGWFLGSQWGKQVTQPALTSSSVKETDKPAANNGIMTLKPILTNLIEPEGTWVRMELSLVLKGQQALEPEIEAEISNDFIALLRQMTLNQIKGPTGLMNLREDLLDRARIRSEGRVCALLISNLVIE